MSERKLTILQINDLHGYLEPHPEVFRSRGGFRYESCGGLARIATVFKQVRAERPSAVLALDNGDTFHGTYVAVESQGEAMVPLMNALEFDAMTAHCEFAYGPEQFQKLASALSYPVLAINCYEGHTLGSGFYILTILRSGRVKREGRILRSYIRQGGLRSRARCVDADLSPRTYSAPSRGFQTIGTLHSLMRGQQSVVAEVASAVDCAMARPHLH